MSEKWQIGIYLIHKENITTKKVYEYLNNEEKTYKQKSKYLLSNLLKLNSKDKYKPQRLKSADIENFEIYLFYRKHSREKPQWKNFLEKIVEDREDIKKQLNNKNESFVMFLYHKKSKNLYAICGGYGVFSIQNYIDDEFGIDILTRIINNKNEKVLKSVKEFGVTGSVAGVTKYFRREYNFNENESFGNIYKEITAYIDKDIASLLGLNNEDIKQCVAKNCFKLKQSLTFDEMIEIINNIDNLLKVKEKIQINDTFKLISNKNNYNNILKTEILRRLFENRLNFESFTENIEFYHKDLEKFISASKIICCNNELDQENILLQIIQKLQNKPKEEFYNNFLSKKVYSYDNENNLLTKDTVFNHLIYEFKFEEKNYFLINGKFFFIEDNFINRLNQNCKDFIEKNYIDGLYLSWNGIGLNNENIKKKGEGAYNLQYKGKSNFIVLDTLTPENIELCDILKYDKENLYLFHIKKGFDGAMRNLCSQIFISAERLKEDILSGYKKFLEKVYEKMQKSGSYKNQIDNKEKFLKLFDKNIIYVLAIKDKNDRNIKNYREIWIYNC